MGGIFGKEKCIREETVKGIVPPYSTVRDEKSLGKRSANQDSVSIGIGEKKAYAR
jgi:hypothetical protein